MGIVSSTLLSLAVQFAWNFQRFLDPKYRYVESKGTLTDVSSLETIKACTEGSTIEKVNKLAVRASPNSNSTTHQENRKRRAAQLRYRTQRPSSFDAALIIRNSACGKTANASCIRVVSSTPSTLKRQQAPVWNDSSSCTSSSSDESDINLPKIDKNHEESMKKCYKDEPDSKIITDEEFSMSAADEAAFRMTVGRGHFSRSKKDKFLNNLRLEKRLNGLNREFFELAYRAHSRSLNRHNSGDLRRIV